MSYEINNLYSPNIIGSQICAQYLCMGGIMSASVCFWFTSSVAELLAVMCNVALYPLF